MGLDPKSVRLNDAENQKRNDDFDTAVEKAAANGNAVLRKLVDAYIDFVNKHGHSPAFPVELVPKSKKTGKG